MKKFNNYLSLRTNQIVIYHLSHQLGYKLSIQTKYIIFFLSNQTLFLRAHYINLFFNVAPPSYKFTLSILEKFVSKPKQENLMP